MRSKTSFFNSTLFWKTVTRFWPIWFAYIFVWAVMMPISLGSSLANAIDYPENTSGIIYALQYLPLEMGRAGAAIVAAIFGCFAAMGSFSHLYSSRSAGAFASLPLKREGVFASVTLAGILPMLAINIIIFLATLTVEAVYTTIYFPALVQWLALVSMLCIFFYGFAVLCAQLTGSLIVLPLVYAVLNFTEFIVEYLVRHIIYVFIYGFAGTGFSLDYLSPLIGIFDRCRVLTISTYDALGRYTTTGYYFSGWGWIIGYAAAGVVLIAGSLMLYKRRRMETAGDVVAVSCLKPVFKYCLAFGCALCIGVLLFNFIGSGYSFAGTSGYVVALICFMFIGCFIGYFAAEMLIWKSFAVWRGRWKGLLVALAVITALSLSCEFDLFGYEKNVPSAAEVKSVNVNTSGDALNLAEPQNIAAALELHESIIADKNYHESRGGGYTCYLYLVYTLEDGSQMKRTYTLAYNINDETGDVRALQDLVNTKEAIDYRKKLKFDISADNIEYASTNYRTPDGDVYNYNYQNLTLTAEEANELYQTCILPDIDDGTLGRIWLIYDEDYLNTVYACSINIECSKRDIEGTYTYQNFYTVPTVDSYRTNTWLEAHGIELHTEGEFQNTDSLDGYKAAVPTD